MNNTETRTVLTILTTAYDRQLPEGLDIIWAATLADVPYGLAREAAYELIRTSPFLPKVAEFRERVRLVKAARDREIGQARQIEARKWTPSKTPRTGADMVRHVLGRLKDAGQDVLNGQALGRERTGDIAEAACAEWLERTSS